jgi:hypothetical protein
MNRNSFEVQRWAVTGANPSIRPQLQPELSLSVSLGDRPRICSYS